MRAGPGSWLVVAAAAVAVLPGCGAAVRSTTGDIAGDLPGRVTEGSLATLEDDATRDRMMALLEGPEVRRATRALVASVLDGSLDAMDDDARAARIAEAADAFVAGIAGSVGDAVDREVGPALARSIARTLEAGLASLAREDNVERIAVVVGALARESVASMASALREELGPALREALREALADEATRRELAESMHDLSRAVVLGVQDGLEEIDRRGTPEHRSDTFIERVRDMGRGGRDLVEIALVMMTLGLLVISLWLMRSATEHRRQIADAHEREAAILALTASLQAGQTPPAEVLELLRTSFGRAARARGAPRRDAPRRDDAAPPIDFTPPRAQEP